MKRGKPTAVIISPEEWDVIAKNLLRLKELDDEKSFKTELLPPDLTTPDSNQRAMAALERLTHLFADLSIPDIEQIIEKPAFRLENAHIEMQAS